MGTTTTTTKPTTTKTITTTITKTTTTTPLGLEGMKSLLAKLASAIGTPAALLPTTTTQAPTTTTKMTIVEEVVEEIEVFTNKEVQSENGDFNFNSKLTANDFVAAKYEEEEEEEVEIKRSPKLTRVAQNTKPHSQFKSDDRSYQIELAELSLKIAESGLTINLFNNQVYNQNAHDTARVVNNHSNDVTFGDKSNTREFL